MATITTAKEIANRILDYVNATERRYNWIQTIPMMKDLGLNDKTSNRTAFRDILETLVEAKHIEKRGDARFEWKITYDTSKDGWNRSDPFEGNHPGADDVENESTGGEDIVESEELKDKYGHYVKPLNSNTMVDSAELKRVQNDLRDAKNRITVIEKELEAKENRLDQLEKLAATASQIVRTMRIERYDGKIFTLKNVVLPSYFQTILDLARCRRNILLVGPAGCGKTTVAELVAKTLGLAFGKVGGSSGLTETHLLGKSNMNLTKGTEKYRPSEFVTRYEKGGVMLVDELDAADQNVLLVLNPALDRSGKLPLVTRLDNPLALKHKDFVCIATANTFGRGQDRIYAGRNQLDGATLSRFQIGTVECYYDAAVERAVCPDDDLRDTIQGIRKRMEEAAIRKVIDTRFLEDAFTMKEHAKWSKDQILTSLFAGWTASEKSKVLAA